MSVVEAQAQIDTLITNSRFRCYRPIRIAEILYHSRTDTEIDIADVESYRVKSATWRDQVSKRLTGKASTSSRSYQKDFSNLIKPEQLAVLDRVNREHDGLVEAYIYHRLKTDKWSGLIAAQEYISEVSVDEFSFETYLSFTDESGLEEDSMLEIAVYALFKGITSELDATAKLELGSPDADILADYSDFVSLFLGLDDGETCFETPVDIHRAGGGTYAADKGIDIGTNFGTMVQVKHVSLDMSNAQSIDETAHVDRLVVVCREADAAVIQNVSAQLGFDKIRGVVTIAELKTWYNRCFDASSSLNSVVLSNLRHAFEAEFQRGSWRIPAIDDFLAERGYTDIDFHGRWQP